MTTTVTVDVALPHLSEGAAYIDGRFRPTDRHIDVLEKATGTVLGTAGLGSLADLDTVVQGARRAQEEWAATPYDVRARLVLDVAGLLETHAEALADLVARETGSILGKAQYEVGGSADELRAAAGLAAQPQGEVLGSHDPGRFSFSERLPVGVVAAITPWNFPLILAMRVVAPAIALGNAVILKASPETPLSGGLAIAALFDEAGAPAGLFQAICGEQEFNEALVAHPGVDMVHFTGSTAVGSKIAATAGGLLKKVSLELGGDNAFVVLDDADAKRASMLGAWSSFHYQGQTCISASRHLVHSTLAAAYTDALVVRAERITVGDPQDPEIGDGPVIGPMINERQAARADDLLRLSVEQGATVVTGGTRDGLFYRPTVVTNVTPTMPIWTEETFAPIVPILAFDTDAEALELVNDTPYGLVNAVVTADEGRGLRFARGCRSGMVHVNDATPTDEASAPFGGVGASGVGGRAGGQANLEEFTERKWISVQQGRPEYPY
ncbi:MAG: aldehyde dehydrogenase family protein [Frondihabitans sp.]|nr:aldehyde dehydrogenase family protein [Frondihabitans sp.]